MCFICSSWCVGSVLFLILVFPFPKQKNDYHLNARLSNYNVQWSLPQVRVPWNLDHELSSGVTTGDQSETPKLLFMLCWGGWKGEQISGCWKYFHPEFGFKVRFYRISGSCNCSGLRIHQFFRPGFWSLHVIKIFLPRFWIQGEILMADLVNKSSGSADLHTPIHPPLYF